ncbi:hypothetical protein RVR_10593 [Actinacidiphila reveromycinica]|uniref:Uncharacterized protein n=1 Tax=Actinacidiphila reveromycinica TaxID=659352 RepID=A0A7U3UXV1_9ACTN|nr:hypothetical protein [Streptomyces sp. SN-593]BBB00594.1 hypothetical protein RVR_7727 [Streptomyces sp. SN-593]BBB00647.1 hypothetical protein RVR_10593 [Streptomyces sp. SN-593]
MPSSPARHEPQVRVIAAALAALVPGAPPNALLIKVTDRGAGGGVIHSWEGSVAGLAAKIHAALLGQSARPAAGRPTHPEDGS